MKGVSTISPGPALTLEPATEDSADELRDALVPAQEDELPQGVLDLLATLIVRQRFEALVPVGVQVSGRCGLVERHREQVESSHRPSHRETHSNLEAQARSLRETHSNVGAGLLAKVAAQAPINPQASSRGPTEAPSTTLEPLPVERAANASPPITFAAETPLPEALMNLHAVRHAPAAAPVSIPLPPMPIPKPALDVMIETLPGSSRGLLQVPFNKGTASGQVTITRVPDEPIQNLQLSPSNSLVFEQLKAPFELARDPGWRLTDTGGEQQHQGSQQQPDEEQTEQQELPA